MTTPDDELDVYQNALKRLARRCHGLELDEAMLGAAKADHSGQYMPVSRNPMDEYVQAVIDEDIEAARKELQ